MELGFHAPDGRTEQPVVGVATKVWTGGRVRRTDTYVFSNIASSDVLMTIKKKNQTLEIAMQVAVW